MAEHPGYITFDSFEAMAEHIITRFPPMREAVGTKAITRRFSMSTPNKLAGPKQPVQHYNPQERKEMGVALLSATRAEAEKKVASLTHQLDEAVATLEGLAPVEPPYGSVIRFRQYGYTWAAINILGDWYVTQDGSRTERQGVPVRSWAGFLAWLDKRNWGTIEVLA